MYEGMFPTMEDIGNILMVPKEFIKLDPEDIDPLKKNLQRIQDRLKKHMELKYSQALVMIMKEYIDDGKYIDEISDIYNILKEKCESEYGPIEDWEPLEGDPNE